jgi:hypothetical protein
VTPALAIIEKAVGNATQRDSIMLLHETSDTFTASTWTATKARPKKSWPANAHQFQVHNITYFLI